MSIIERIISILEIRGLKRADLARHIGKSTGQISMWEKRKSNPLYSSFDVISRHEYRADRKSVLDFLPIEKIKEAIKSGCHTTYEFAEYLDVPEQFIIKAFEHYNAMNLI